MAALDRPTTPNLPPDFYTDRNDLNLPLYTDNVQYPLNNDSNGGTLASFNSEQPPDYLPPSRRVPTASLREPKFSFKRVENRRWLVLNDHDGSLAYEVTYERATPEHVEDETIVKDGIDGVSSPRTLS